MMDLAVIKESLVVAGGCLAGRHQPCYGFCRAPASDDNPAGVSPEPVTPQRGVGQTWRRRSHGPVIANTKPGLWMLANKICPSSLKVGPVNSLPFRSLRASA